MHASIGKPDAQDSGAPTWCAAFWALWLTLCVARLWLAWQLAPFGDEAWYWQESRHLAWGYSDLPPLTAWLIACGEILFGHGVLGMRAAFLALGAVLPLLVAQTARGLFGACCGWAAGMLALGLPLLSTLGIFALPDVPLTFAAIVALQAAIHAVRDARLRHWTLLGVALACAFLAHYRGAMLVASGALFLCATRRGRACLRTPGPWLAAAIAACGMLPALWFNVRHHWVALDFQLVQRNPWVFHADALVQPLEQALVCTPLFYGLLLWTLWRIGSQSTRPVAAGFKVHSPVRGAAAARTGDAAVPWDLLLCCSALPIGAWFALGLFADDTRFRVHWPLPGYLPLLVAMPALLQASRLAAWFRVAAFASLALGSALAFVYLGVAASPGGAGALAGIKAFPQQFVGWREAAAQTQHLLRQPRFADAILVADNFMLAAELQFAQGASRPVYSLDHPLNAKHGRAAQLALWQRDEAGLHAQGVGHAVLLVAEPGARRERDRAAWLESLCSRIDALAPVARLNAYEGRKRYRWYSGTVAAQPLRARQADCVAARP